MKSAQISLQPTSSELSHFIMQFSTLVAALAAVAVLPAMALPTAEAEALTEPQALDHIEKRVHNMHVCEKSYVSVISSALHLMLTIVCNRNWGGRCVTYTPQWNECTSWAALGLIGLGSWGPSSGTLFLVA